MIPGVGAAHAAHGGATVGLVHGVASQVIARAGDPKATAAVDPKLVQVAQHAQEKPALFGADLLLKAHNPKRYLELAQGGKLPSQVLVQHEATGHLEQHLRDLHVRHGEELRRLYGSRPMPERTLLGLAAVTGVHRDVERAIDALHAHPHYPARTSFTEIVRDFRAPEIARIATAFRDPNAEIALHAYREAREAREAEHRAERRRILDMLRVQWAGGSRRIVPLFEGLVRAWSPEQRERLRVAFQSGGNVETLWQEIEDANLHARLVSDLAAFRRWRTEWEASRLPAVQTPLDEPQTLVEVIAPPAPDVTALTAPASDAVVPAPDDAEQDDGDRPLTLTRDAETRPVSDEENQEPESDRSDTLDDDAGYVRAFAPGAYAADGHVTWGQLAQGFGRAGEARLRDAWGTGREWQTYRDVLAERGAETTAARERAFLRRIEGLGCDRFGRCRLSRERLAELADLGGHFAPEQWARLAAALTEGEADPLAVWRAIERENLGEAVAVREPAFLRYLGAPGHVGNPGLWAREAPRLGRVLLDEDAAGILDTLNAALGAAGGQRPEGPAADLGASVGQGLASIFGGNSSAASQALGSLAGAGARALGSAALSGKLGSFAQHAVAALTGRTVAPPMGPAPMGPPPMGPPPMGPPPSPVAGPVAPGVDLRPALARWHDLPLAALGESVVPALAALGLTGPATALPEQLVRLVPVPLPSGDPSGWWDALTLGQGLTAADARALRAAIDADGPAGVQHSIAAYQELLEVPLREQMKGREALFARILDAARRVAGPAFDPKALPGGDPFALLALGAGDWGRVERAMKAGGDALGAFRAVESARHSQRLHDDASARMAQMLGTLWRARQANGWTPSGGAGGESGAVGGADEAGAITARRRYVVTHREAGMPLSPRFSRVVAENIAIDHGLFDGTQWARPDWWAELRDVNRDKPVDASGWWRDVHPGEAIWIPAYWPRDRDSVSSLEATRAPFAPLAAHFRAVNPADPDAPWRRYQDGLMAFFEKLCPHALGEAESFLREAAGDGFYMALPGQGGLPGWRHATEAEIGCLRLSAEALAMLAPLTFWVAPTHHADVSNDAQGPDETGVIEVVGDRRPRPIFHLGFGRPMAEHELGRLFDVVPELRQHPDGVLKEMAGLRSQARDVRGVDATTGEYIRLPGESHEVIAEKLVGDRTRWRELAAANPGGLHGLARVRIPPGWFGYVPYRIPHEKAKIAAAVLGGPAVAIGEALGGAFRRGPVFGERFVERHRFAPVVEERFGRRRFGALTGERRMRRFETGEPETGEPETDTGARSGAGWHGGGGSGHAGGGWHAGGGHGGPWGARGGWWGGPLFVEGSSSEGGAGPEDQPRIYTVTEYDARAGSPRQVVERIAREVFGVANRPSWWAELGAENPDKPVDASGAWREIHAGETIVIPESWPEPSGETGDVRRIVRWHSMLVQNANLHEGPGIEFGVVRVLAAGTRVRIQRHVGEWSRVRVAPGLHGWVRTAMLGGFEVEDIETSGIDDAETGGAGDETGVLSDRQNLTQTTYEVKPGDSMVAIAKKFGATSRPWFRELRDANPQKKIAIDPVTKKQVGWVSLNPGDVINIPDAWVAHDHPEGRPAPGGAPAPAPAPGLDQFPKVPGLHATPAATAPPGFIPAGATVDPGTIQRVQAILAAWGRAHPGNIRPRGYGSAGTDKVSRELLGVPTKRMQEALGSFQRWSNRTAGSHLRDDGLLDPESVTALDSLSAQMLGEMPARPPIVPVLGGSPPLLGDGDPFKQVIHVAARTATDLMPVVLRPVVPVPDVHAGVYQPAQDAMSRVIEAVRAGSDPAAPPPRGESGPVSPAPAPLPPMPPLPPDLYDQLGQLGLPGVPGLPDGAPHASPRGQSGPMSPPRDPLPPRGESGPMLPPRGPRLPRGESGPMLPPRPPRGESGPMSPPRPPRGESGPMEPPRNEPASEAPQKKGDGLLPIAAGVIAAVSGLLPRIF